MSFALIKLKDGHIHLEQIQSGTLAQNKPQAFRASRTMKSELVLRPENSIRLRLL